MNDDKKKQTTLQDVLDYILTAGQDDMVTIGDHWKTCFQVTRSEARRNLSVGDWVEWDETPSWPRRGTIIEMFTHNAVVETDIGTRPCVSIAVLRPAKKRKV